MTPAEYIKVTSAEYLRNRVSLGLSQEDVAEAVGVSAASISAWERGKSIPNAYSRTVLVAFFKKQWADREDKGVESAKKVVTA